MDMRDERRYRRNSRGQFASRGGRRDRGYEMDERRGMRRDREHEMRRGGDYNADMARGRGGMQGGRDRNYGMDERYDRRTPRDRGDYEMDERRAMRYREEFEYDEGYDNPYDNGYDRRYDDYDSHYDMEYNQPMFLDRKTIKRWMADLENADGSMGAKFNKEQVSQKAEQLGIKAKNVEPEEWYAAVNMFYSDYCKTLGGDLQLYLKMAKDFFDDPDAGLQGGEKLAAYYYSIVEA